MNQKITAFVIVYMIYTVIYIYTQSYILMDIFYMKGNTIKLPWMLFKGHQNVHVSKNTDTA